MHRIKRIVLSLMAVLSLSLSPPVHAGTTGKIVGVIRGENKEALPAVNLRVVGQRLGAISDDAGRFTIVGVPAGTQAITATLIGYGTTTVEKIDVTADFTTEVNITLKTDAVQLEEIKVDATRPLLQKDATSTARFLSSEDIQKLPTRGYKEAAALQSGIVNFARNIDRENSNGATLIVRGGRPNETAYYVDGFSQQDPLTGNSTTTINNNAIEEVVIMNGGFSAEYGRIMSGVINVITKDGGDNYTGSIEALTDNLSSGDEFMGGRIYDYNLYDGAFGGPLVKGKGYGSFYVSGQRRWQEDRQPVSNYLTPKPSNSLGGWTGQAKVNVNLGQKASVRFGLLNSDDDWREYRNSYRFNLAHAPRYEDRNRSYTGQYNQTVNNTSFFNLAVTYFQTERKRGDGVFFDNLPGYASSPDIDLINSIPWFFPGVSGTPGDPLSDSLAAAVLRVPGSTGALWDDYLRRKSQYTAFKGDYTNQVNSYHQMKSGFQVDQHELRFYQNYFPAQFAPNQNDIDGYGFDAYGNEGEISSRDGAREPTTASLYLQDKYERSGLVVNAGLRWDYIDVNTDALVNEDTPLGANGVLDDSDLTDSKTYSRISPRIGVGFPVTDRTVMHINWGQFYQQPNLQDLYVSYRFLEYKIQNGGYFVPFGNPNLRPEMTTAYEVGIAHQLSPVAVFDLTAYYKDVKDLVQITSVKSSPNSFSTFRNKDFATLKGFDLGFSLRRINHISANIGYSMSLAKGTGSVSNTQRNIAWTSSEPPRQTSPLDFDQRHKLAVNLDYFLARGEGPKLGSATPFSDFGINVLYNIASGTPYTSTFIYDEVTQANVSSQPTGALNSRYGPWTQTLDLKATKMLPFGGANVRMYLWLLNAFNTNNAVQVYTGTGSAYTDGYLNTPEGQAVAATLATQSIDARQAYDLALQNQSLFSTPRTVRFGVQLGF